MARHPEKHQYALELSRDAEVNVGTIYAVLARLEQQGLVSSTVEGIDPIAEGRPARRYYLLTAEGLAAAREEIRKTQRLMTLGGRINA
ncbi:hypothetical protein GCM10010844_37870 [Deinococcus radiotolerans]|uniref:Transcription regulator PadR N-terminal domain-containing protein n=2 Tax=Deinococcus radiotolerans TaxID=1309407 RepID=A0ABQ2FQ13_9DEIO|nr:hypothetical protein GCM10010844_37870 [Deinococcus radiotolerans]